MRSYLLDANLINARQKNHELNEIERRFQLGEISLQFTRTAYDEAAYGSKFRELKTELFTWVDVDRENGRYVTWFKRIEAIVFPKDVMTQNERNDVDHLVVAQQTGLPFVTADGASKTQPGGILEARDKLMPFGIIVLSVDEAFREITNQ